MPITTPITYSVNENEIGDAEFWRELREIGAGFADCGQYAAGRADYRVGSIHPATHHEQPLTDKAKFPFEDGLGADAFRNWTVPANAQGVCFFDFSPQTPARFHYGRLEPHLSITMTDANLAKDNPLAGGFTTHLSDMQEIAEAGIQSIRRLPNVHAFVDYCEANYPTTHSRYFFVYFGSKAKT
jgi:hypothetical protein